MSLFPYTGVLEIESCRVGNWESRDSKHYRVALCTGIIRFVKLSGVFFSKLKAKTLDLKVLKECFCVVLSISFAL